MFKFRLESRDHKDTDLVALGVHVSARLVADNPPRQRSSRPRSPTTVA